MEDQNQEQTQKVEGFILKSKAGHWMWELHIDGEMYQAGAGYETQGDAIEGLYEANGDRFEFINLVLTKEAGE